MKFLRFIVMFLLIVGGLNWGLVGFFKYNLIADIFGGEASPLSRIIFSLVGLAGLFAIGFFCKSKSCCCGASCGSRGEHTCGKKDNDQQRM